MASYRSILQTRTSIWWHHQVSTNYCNCSNSDILASFRWSVLCFIFGNLKKLWVLRPLCQVKIIEIRFTQKMHNNRTSYIFSYFWKEKHIYINVHLFPINYVGFDQRLTIYLQSCIKSCDFIATFHVEEVRWLRRWWSWRE